jgi:ketosteroid isomerase-like protein
MAATGRRRVRRIPGGAAANPARAAVARAFVGAINRGDLASILGLMASGYTFVDSVGRVHKGRRRGVAGWRQFLAMFPDYRIRITHALESGSTVALFGSASGTYAGKRGLVRANRIRMAAAWKAVIQGDRVRLWQVYADWTEGLRIINEDSRSC